MPDAELPPATDLAARNPVRQPGESAGYRTARTALLAREYELRRLREAVAEQRRALPPGPAIDGDYRFKGEAGETDLAGLFSGNDTLIVYNYMFKPQGNRKRPCPMCSTLLASWDGNARSIQQNAALAIVARAPIADMLAFKAERGWQHLPLYEDVTGAFSRDVHAVGEDDMDNPAFTVFTKAADGDIRLFWAEEMALSDPGQDPRGNLDQMPLWVALDSTPQGRKPDWYPTLDD